MKINPKYIQLIGDAVIPLVGFFAWDWSLYFILLFYFIDLVIGEVVVNLKSRKIVEYQKSGVQGWIIRAWASGLLLIGTVLLIHFILYWVVSGIDFRAEAIEFWTYEELGIQQGYILLPLLIIAAVQQYRIYFLLPARYRTQQLEDLWKKRISSLLIVAVGALLAFALFQFVVIPAWVIVVVIVAATSVYGLRFNN